MATCFSLPAAPNSFMHFPSNPKSHKKPIHCSSLTSQYQSQSQKNHLLNLISDQERGLRTQSDPQKLSEIIQAIEGLANIGRDTVTTGSSLSATWRLLWTTEKEQLYIIKNTPFFGTKAGDVLQVIDVEKKTLNNVITFPPVGVFFVRSTIEVSSSQRVNFRLQWNKMVMLSLGRKCVGSANTSGNCSISWLMPTDSQVQFCVEKIGNFLYHHLDKGGLRLCTLMMRFE